MSDFTVFAPEAEDLASSQDDVPVTDDGDSEFESVEDSVEVIEGELDSDVLEELDDAYFDAEEEILDDDDDDIIEDEDDDLSDEEDEGETETEGESFQHPNAAWCSWLTSRDEGAEPGTRERVRAEAAAAATDATILDRRATMALLARLQGGLFGGDDDAGFLPGRRRNRQVWNRKIAEEPDQAGVDLLNSGEFGQPTPSHTLESSRRFPYSVRTKLLEREFSPYKRPRVRTAEHFLPTSNGRLAVQYPARAYSGQFSQDGSFFYTCSQDFRVRLYDTTDPTQWKHYKTVLGGSGRWTITDANLSPDNRFVAYSSITPVVYMAKTAQDNTEEQEMLDFAGPRRMGYNNGIWSIRFSSDGREIVAGAGDKRVYVYDIETKQVVLGVRGHEDDVNAVCFADQSTNVLFSGSDDCVIKVWDRRSMGSRKEAGALPGHTEGITFISSKGDGRYVISNGKDQTTKLWDIRKLVSAEKWHTSQRIDYATGFDYRHQEFPGNQAQPHPDDRSVMTYTGHAILKTLIRCGFSPAATTDQQYIYSGSDCGKVWIWNLDGTVNRTLDLGRAAKVTHSTQPSRRRFLGFGGGSDRACIRDASWHPTLPYLASTSWHSEMDAGSIYLHEFGESEEHDMYETGSVLRSGIREPSYRTGDFWM